MALLLARPDLATSASAASRRPAVRRRRRPALVARAERPRPAFALLRRSAVAAVRGRGVRPHHRRRRACSTSARRSSRRRCSRPDAHEAYGQPRVSAEDGHAVRALRARDRQGAHRRRARPAALRQRRLERRHEPRRRRRDAARAHGSASSCTHVLSDFAPLCRRAEGSRRGPTGTCSEARRLAITLERSWDGEWYRRGYYDDGTPLGSAQNDECRIDSISQSWAVLSGAVPTRFAERAMDAVRTFLVARARADPAAAPSAVRSIGAGAGLHQGLSARRPRERRAVHARGRLDRDGPGPARKRRRGGGVLPHAEPGQPRAARRPTSRATRPSRT